MSSVVNLSEKFSLFDECWVPKIVGEFDNSYVKIFKAKGAFDKWHSHTQGDQFCLVLRGELIVKLRDREIRVSAREFFIIPKGVEHCAHAEQVAHVLLIESKTVVDAGQAGEQRPEDLERL